MLYNSRLPYRRTVNQMERLSEIIWLTAGTLCPCMLGQGEMVPGQPDPTHALCRGTGRLHRFDHTRAMRAMVSRFSAAYTPSDFGDMQPGDILVSPIPGDAVTLNQWDLIRLPDWQQGEPFEGQILRRPDAAGGTNFLTYEPARIEAVYGLVGTPEVVTDFVPGIDYTLGADGHTMTWLRPSPQAGLAVSIRYRARMDYLVIDPPQVRYERGSDLGERVLCRRMHLVPPGVTLGTGGQGALT